jgi:hypothetical protein
LAGFTDRDPENCAIATQLESPSTMTPDAIDSVLVQRSIARATATRPGAVTASKEQITATQELTASCGVPLMP